jgi:post-segregation antitoxin (ccd killing protein)
MKSILIDESIHKQLKIYSKATGIKIKVLVETAIKSYLNKMKIKESEEENKNGIN